MDTTLVFELLCTALLVMSHSIAADAARSPFGVRAMLAVDVDEIRPAPASIGAAVPLTYFGPAPSSVQKELVGPYQLLKSGTIDLEQGTITMPLYRGTVGGASSTPQNRAASPMSSGGASIWYVLTDTSDFQNAAALGINPSAKLTYGNAPGAARQASLLNDGTLRFDAGTVDFSPVRVVVPGDAPKYFPPKNVTAGSKGDASYSPLFVLTNGGGHVYNGPIVAGDVTAAQLSPYCGGISANQSATAYSILHDKVLSICPDGNGGNVTLKLTPGFSFGKPVLYLSLEGSATLVAALEDVTEAPAMTNLVVGGDDGAFSAVERLFTTTNGYTNGDINVNKLNTSGPVEENHPLRQGLSSALRGDSDGAGPLNILGGIPTVATDYSPLWDLNVGEWTDYAVKNYYRTQIRDEFTYLGMVEQGFITGPGGNPFGSSGFIVNCPIAHRFL